MNTHPSFHLDLLIHSHPHIDDHHCRTASVAIVVGVASTRVVLSGRNSIDVDPNNFDPNNFDLNTSKDAKSEVGFLDLHCRYCYCSCGCDRSSVHLSVLLPSLVVVPLVDKIVLLLE